MLKYLFLRVLMGVLLLGVNVELHATELINKTKFKRISTETFDERTDSQGSDAPMWDSVAEHRDSKYGLHFRAIDINFDRYFYEESPLKRSETIFFLSIPFIVLVHVIALAATYFIATQDVTFASFPLETFFFAGASSLMIVGGVIYLDYQKNNTLSEDAREYQRLRLRYTHPL